MPQSMQMISPIIPVFRNGLSRFPARVLYPRQCLDAVNRPVGHLLDACAHARNVQQQESHRHEALHAVVLLVGEPVANVRKV